MSLGNTRFSDWSARGFGSYLTPVTPNGKSPLLREWLDLDISGALDHWDRSSCNVGMKTGRLVVVDIDLPDQTLVSAAKTLCANVLGALGPIRGRPDAQKVAVAYRMADSLSPPRKRMTGPYHDPLGREQGVEILGLGQQVVIEGQHPDGQMYAWDRSDFQPEDLPEVASEDLLDELVTKMREMLEASGLVPKGRLSATSGSSSGSSELGSACRDDAQWACLGQIMGAIPNENLHWDDWTRIGLALRGSCGDDPSRLDDARSAWLGWSAKSSKDDPAESETRWDEHLSRAEVRDIGWGTLVRYARDAGWQPPRDARSAFDAVGGAGGAFGAVDPASVPGDEAPSDPLVEVSAGSWHGLVVPSQEWILEGWLPKGEVTTLYGRPGLGKSYVVQMLGICLALGKPWFGIEPWSGAPSRVLHVSCEDDIRALHMREARIMRSRFEPLSALGDRHVFVGRRGSLWNDLVAFSGPGGTMSRTRFWHDLRDAILAGGYSLVVIDTIPDVYPGNENDRHQVNSFVKAGLAALADETGAAVLCLAHPSKSALSDGLGYSGTTAWDGAVRSRWDMRLRDPEDRSGLIELEHAKGNYGAPMGTILLQWDRTLDMLVSRGTAGSPADKAALDAKAEHYLLKGIEEAERQGVLVSPAKQSPAYISRWIAENTFREEPWGQMIGEAELDAAKRRLLASDKIEVREGLGANRKMRKIFAVRGAETDARLTQTDAD